MELQEVQPEVRVIESEENYGHFRIEPLKRGYGHTLGNAMRRVLLSSLPGAAISSIRITGVLHEFADIPDVTEDVTQIILNIKRIRLTSSADVPIDLYLSVNREGIVTASDIQCPPEVNIVNPDQLIATLDSDSAELEMSLTVEQGIGFTLSNTQEDTPIGVVPVDAIFTPIRRVEYRVEHARVGQVTDLDALILRVWTDGTLTPETALGQCGQILCDYFSLIRDFHPLAQRIEVGIARPDPISSTPLESLQLQNRAYNALRRGGISTVEQLLAMDEDNLLKIQGLGAKTLSEVKERLAQSDLFLTESNGTGSAEEVEEVPV
ncbi:MAG: DNA-directed RNA polymerase subunit alpha [Chloroflexi bacterium]|nr:DNA-directed RNA polymerase subunit alpha [Chloroflexota bacterium]